MHPRIEHRQNITGPQLTHTVATHLKERCGLGVSVVIVEKPIAFLSTLRKNWIKFERQLQRQRASTVNPIRIVAITTMLGDMFRAKFSASRDWNDADIYVFGVDFPEFSVPVQTVYICTPLTHDQRLTIRHGLADDAIIIDFTR